jgi:hypothetical protein
VGNIVYRGALLSVSLTKYHSADQMKRNLMGETCSTYGGQKKFVQGFGGEN